VSLLTTWCVLAATPKKGRAAPARKPAKKYAESTSEEESEASDDDDSDAPKKKRGARGGKAAEGSKRSTRTKKRVNYAKIDADSDEDVRFP